MMRMAFIGIAAALIASDAGAQNPPSPAFEVASVKANRSGAQMQAFPTLQPSGRVFAINLPLRELIRTAYGLRDNELVISSPLADTPFDIEARAAAGVTSERAVLMLRTLLADRFGLQVHTETRQLPVYVLKRVSATSLGPRMKPSGPECAPWNPPSADGGTAPPPPPPPPPPPEHSGTPLGASRRFAECPTMFFSSGLSARAMGLDAFAVAIERIVRRPVIDRTGLTGRFDMDMTFAPEFDGPATTAPAGTAPAFATALREQLGLRLEGDRAAMTVLVVDRVERPREN